MFIERSEQPVGGIYGRQYELMVGSYNAATPDNNGGRLGFYPVDGVNNSVTKRIEYSGFAKIRDVVYRERR